MTVPPTSSSGIGRNGLSGRDWLILPLLSLLTIASILFAMEKVARLAFPDSGHSINECMVINDPSLGVHARPNSMCTEQLPESGLVEYRFNRCGHRSVMECGPKSKGIYRIVVLGSSAALGVSVARERTFAALLPALLSRDTGRPVEVYDAAVEYQRPAALALQLNRILAEEPADEILWILTPTDIRDASDVAPDQGELRRSGLFAAIRNQAAGVVETRSFSRLQNAMHFLLNRSRAATIIRHYWYLSMSPNRYVDSYLQSGDFESGFLRAQPGAEWQDRIRKFDGFAGKILDQVNASGLPLTAALIPNRAQATMIITKQWKPGFDPYKLDSQLREIVEKHGGTDLDILRHYREEATSAEEFFPVDGHPNAQGNAVFSALLARELTSGVVPALKAAAPANSALEETR